jgi:hypothetical protein
MTDCIDGELKVSPHQKNTGGMGTPYIIEGWTVSPQVQAAGIDWYQHTSLCIRMMSGFSERVNEFPISSLNSC